MTANSDAAAEAGDVSENRALPKLTSAELHSFSAAITPVSQGDKCTLAVAAGRRPWSLEQYSAPPTSDYSRRYRPQRLSCFTSPCMESGVTTSAVRSSVCGHALYCSFRHVPSALLRTLQHGPAVVLVALFPCWLLSASHLSPEPHHISVIPRGTGVPVSLHRARLPSSCHAMFRPVPMGGAADSFSVPVPWLWMEERDACTRIHAGHRISGSTVPGLTLPDKEVVEDVGRLSGRPCVVTIPCSWAVD